MEITVRSNQSIFDIAMMTCGIAEVAYDIALANNVSITDNMVGKTLVIPEVIKNKKIVEYYTINSITPATDLVQYGKKNRNN